MKTAKDKVTDSLSAGDEVSAMRIASKWQNLGKHKKAIAQGWASRTNRAFYIEMGNDPDALWIAGVNALKERLCYV